MNCTDFKSGIFPFREEELPEDLRRLYETHLLSCPACSKMMAEFDNLDEIIRLEKATEPAPFTATRIIQYVENNLAGSKNMHSRVWINILRPVTIAAAVLCGFLIGSTTSKNGTARTDQMVNATDNIEFLRTNLFIAEFADEDKILEINK